MESTAGHSNNNIASSNVAATMKKASHSEIANSAVPIQSTTAGTKGGSGRSNKNRIAHRFQNQKLYRSLLEIAVCVGFIVFALLYATGATTTFGELYTAAKAQGMGGLTKPSLMRITIKKVTAIAEDQMGNTMLLIVVGYLLLQTFCVPGTVVLNAIIGALLGVLVGVPFAVMLGTIGASSCYTLSSVLGVSLVEAVDAKLMKGKGVAKIRNAVSRYRSDLFVYLLFLRLTPILPNWLVNLGAPVANIPLFPFAMATMVGIIPQTYLTVRFGTLVNAFGADDGDSNAPIVTIWDTLLLVMIAVALLIINRLKKKFSSE